MANVEGTTARDFIDEHYVDGSGHSVTAGADFVDGDAGDDVISGLGGNDTLLGSFGDDVLVGGPGADAMYGGVGNNDWASYFDAASGIRADLTTGTGRFDDAEGDTFFQIENLNGSDHDDVFIGDSSANMLLGLSGNDIIAGRGGADQLFGFGGLDAVDYSSSPAGVTVSLLTGRGSGGDAAGDVFAGFESVFGSLFADVLTGDDGDNVISALTGDDVLQGHAGSDTLFAGGGNDTLDGGTGADLMIGEDGDDTYLVDNAGDVVDETGLSDLDTVLTAVSFSLADAAHAKGAIENLTLIGTAAINGTGNALANVITGNAGANTLDGAAGADTLRGGAGNDTYVVDNTGDVVDESVAGSNGSDTVRSAVSFSLLDTAHAKGAIENLTLTGDAAINGTGNAGANSLVGNAAANILAGNLGNDILTGAAGGDTFLFDTKPNKTANVDHITDMVHLTDLIELDHDTFKKLDLGKLHHGAFFKSAHAKHADDEDDRIVYNTTSGDLYYDRDGAGGHHAKLFAVLDGSPDHISAKDFLIIA